MERLLGLPGDGVELSTSSGRDDGSKGAFDKGSGNQPGSDAGLRQELEREFGTQYGRAEIHDHDDAFAIVSRDDGLRYGDRIGAETII